MTTLVIKRGRRGNRTKTGYEVASVSMGNTGTRVVIRTEDDVSIWLPVEILRDVMGAVADKALEHAE